MPGSDGSYVERRVVRDGRGIHVREHPGPEPPVVLMHGFPDSLDVYDALVPHLAGRRRLVLFDFVGWGRSDRSSSDAYTFENLTRDLDAVVRQLGLERPVLVAHDASGPPAIDWALAHPGEVGDLVLLNTFYMMMLRLRPPEAVLLYMTPLLRHAVRLANHLSRGSLNARLYRFQLRRFVRDDDVKDELIPRLYAGWRTSWPAFRELVASLPAASIRRARKANLDCLRTYGGRVRIVFGARDPYLNVHVARRFHDLFPRSELSLVESARHYVQVDEPELVARLILEPDQPEREEAPELAAAADAGADRR